MDAMCLEKNLSEFHCSMVGFGLISTYIILGLATVLAVLLPLISSLNNPKALLKVLAGVGVLVVLFLACYFISSDKLSDPALAAGLGITGYKLVGGGLTMFYIVFVIAFGALFFTELKNVKSAMEAIKILLPAVIVVLALISGVDGGLYLTYGIMIVVLAVLLFGIFVSSRTGSTEKWRMAYWLGFFVILGGIAFALAGDEVKPFYKIAGVDSTQSRFVETGLIMFYLALLASIIGVVYSEINKALK
jgi:hypothetical protein